MSTFRVLPLSFALISLLALCPTSTLSKPESEVFIADGYADEGTAAAAAAAVQPDKAPEIQDQANGQVNQSPSPKPIVTDAKQEFTEAPIKSERSLELENHNNRDENQIGNEIENQNENQVEEDSKIQKLENAVKRLGSMEQRFEMMERESQHLREELHEMNTTLSEYVEATGGIRRVIACEYTLLTLQCEIGTIQINSGYYGRKSNEVCNGSLRFFNNNKFSKAVNCVGKETDLQVLQKHCESKKSCNIMATNGNFGDPCVGIIKYVKVNYQCIV